MGSNAAVLLIDDDVDLLDVLKETLTVLCKIENIVIATSLSGAQKQEAEVLKCQMAILDVNLGMHQPSGVDIATWLRQIGFKGRIVFLTGHAKSDPEVIAATKVPDTLVMSKPIGLNQLLDFVKGM